MNTEGAFIAALEKVRSWRVRDQHLELFDDAGELVVRFEARYLQWGR